MTHDILHRPLSELTNISFSCAADTSTAFK